MINVQYILVVLMIKLMYTWMIDYLFDSDSSLEVNFSGSQHELKVTQGAFCFYFFLFNYEYITQ